MQRSASRCRPPRKRMFMRSPCAVARLGCHVLPSADYHTSIQGVRGVNASSVARRTAQRVLWPRTGGRKCWPASGTFHARSCNVSQTLANYHTCSRLQWLPRVTAARTATREALLRMQRYGSRRRAPRKRKLVPSPSALARHGCRAPPSAECHATMQGVRGVKAGSVARRLGGEQSEEGGARARGAPPVLMPAS